MSDEEFPDGAVPEEGSSDGDMGDMGDMGVPAELPDGVQKEILKDGEGWKKPKKGDEVEVHYVGTLQADGSQFDSSHDRGKPFTFTLGKGQVIAGWDAGVASMLKGETAKFTLSPSFAYGESGSPPKIPANATLVFEVELLGWTSKDDLFGDEGVIKSVVEEGSQTWKHPKNGGEVFLSVKVTAEDGSVVEDKSDFDYVMGAGSLGPLSRVVDKALLAMSKGSKCSLACAKDYIYEGSAHGAVTVDLHLQEIYTVSDVSFAKDKSVMKKATKEGEGYEKAQDGFAVVLKVEAVADAAGGALPGFVGPTELSFEAGNGEVCDVLEHAVADMKKGERAILYCAAAALPKLAEPKLGLGQDLGALSVKGEKAVLTLELSDMTKPKDLWEMANQEKVELALKRKEQGGKLFAGKRFELALEKYKKAGDAVASHDSYEEDLKAKALEVKKIVELNKAACFLKLGDPAGVITSCDKVLKDDSNNVKALFRRGKARHERRDHMDALADFERVLVLDANNAEAKVLIQHVKRAQKLVDKQAKATFAKMCGGFGKLGADERTRKAVAKSDESDESDFSDGGGEDALDADDAQAAGAEKSSE